MKPPSHHQTGAQIYNSSSASSDHQASFPGARSFHFRAGSRIALLTLVLGVGARAPAQPAPDPGAKTSSYAPVRIEEPFDSIQRRMAAAKPGIMQSQLEFLAERYDLANRPADGVTMTRGKPVQQGARARLKPGLTWAMLAALTPDEIRAPAPITAGPNTIAFSSTWASE